MSLHYNKYLQSGHWIRTRERRKIYDRFKCVICSSGVRLNVHHRRYKDSDGVSFLGREPKGLLKTLCQDCHHIFHEIYGMMNLNNKRIQRIKNLLSVGVSKREAFEVVRNGGYKKAYNKNRQKDDRPE